MPGGAQPVPTLICCFQMFGKVGINNCRADSFLARSWSGFCDFFSKSNVAIHEQKDKRNICFPSTNMSLLTGSALQAECWSLVSGRQHQGSVLHSQPGARGRRGEPKGKTWDPACASEDPVLSRLLARALFLGATTVLEESCCSGEV